MMNRFPHSDKPGEPTNRKPNKSPSANKHANVECPVDAAHIRASQPRAIGAPIPLNTFELTGFLFLGSLIAGVLGSLTGLGGGVVIVPLLTLAFGVDIRYAIGASLVSVIATSSGAAAAYVREGFSNIRVGMFLEIATTVGAIAGAIVAAYLKLSWIAIIFGFVLLYSAYEALQSRSDARGPTQPDHLATILRMDASFPPSQGMQSYHVTNVPAGFSLMFTAGVLSGVLGIGSGAVKVLAMDRAMKLPFKVSTTTSNFMIGVTAAASAGVYLNRGYIDPGLAMPVMLGVLGGSLTGARLLAGAKVKILRIVFSTVVALLGLEMMYNGFVGKFACASNVRQARRGNHRHPPSHGRHNRCHRRLRRRNSLPHPARLRKTGLPRLSRRARPPPPHLRNRQIQHGSRSGSHHSARNFNSDSHPRRPRRILRVRLCRGTRLDVCHRHPDCARTALVQPQRHESMIFGVRRLAALTNAGNT